MPNKPPGVPHATPAPAEPPTLTVSAPHIYPCTDLGNAERFVARHGEAVRYVPLWKSWLVWDRRRWIRDTIEQVETWSAETVRAIHGAEVKRATGDAKEKLLKHAHMSEAHGAMRAMVERARSLPGMAVRPDALDQHPMLLAVGNGTLDLRTGRLRPFDRDLLLTRATSVPFAAEATCPTWEAFLGRVFDGNHTLIRYLQRAVGYSLTGDTSERCLHLCYGSGANGKSTFTEAISKVAGEYASTADFASFVDRQFQGGGANHSEDIARLAGARLVTAGEVGEGKRLDEAAIKILTGQDRIVARFAYGKSFEYRPQFHLWLHANHKPVIRGTDYGIWSRLRLIPFTVTIPEAERDKSLDAKLAAELPGILAWAVAGCVMWQRDGLSPPDEVSAATDAYREESDVIGGFLEECCEVAEPYEVGSSPLYDAYKLWAKTNSEYVLSQTAFGRRIQDRGFAMRKTSGRKFRVGLKLRDEISGRLGRDW